MHCCHPLYSYKNHLAPYTQNSRFPILRPDTYLVHFTFEIAPKLLASEASCNIPTFSLLCVKVHGRYHGSACGRDRLWSGKAYQGKESRLTLDARPRCQPARIYTLASAEVFAKSGGENIFNHRTPKNATYYSLYNANFQICFFRERWADRVSSYCIIIVSKFRLTNGDREQIAAHTIEMDWRMRPKNHETRWGFLMIWGTMPA